MISFNFARLRFLLALTLCGLFFLALAVPARADSTTTYIYTGNSFNAFSGNYSCPPECFISGFFIIAGPPPTNLVGTSSQFDFDVSPLYYSFSDGSATANSSNSCADFFEISTDGEGNITDWTIRLFTPSQNAPCNGGGTYTGVQLLTTNESTSTIDITIQAPAATDFAAVAQQPGTWVTRTPEPASALFMLTGIACLLAVRRFIHNL